MPLAPHGRNGQIAHLYRSVKCLCKSIHIPLTLFSFLSTSFTLSRFGRVGGISIPCALYPSSTTIEMPNISIHRNAVSQRLHSGTRFFAVATTTVLRCRLPCRKIYYYLWSWRKFICRMVVWPRSVQQRQCGWKKELAKRTLNLFIFFFHRSLSQQGLWFFCCCLHRLVPFVIALRPINEHSEKGQKGMRWKANGKSLIALKYLSIYRNA